MIQFYFALGALFVIYLVTDSYAVRTVCSKWYMMKGKICMWL